MRRTPRPVLDPGGPHYRVSEVADAYGVDPGTVLRWIHGGTLEAKRSGTRGMFLVPKHALVAAGLLGTGAAETNDPEPTTAPAEATQLITVGEDR